MDVIIDVVDASSLERSLYLTLQLLELRQTNGFGFKYDGYRRKAGHGY